MKIVILGSAGMLGQHLCEELSDFELVCLDVKDLDITVEEDVRKKMAEVGPDVIINAAAYTDVDGAEDDIETAMAVNKEGVKNLAQIAKELGVKIVHYSTDYVFSGEKREGELGYSENDSPGPAVNAYGESKLAGERVLIEIAPEFYLIRTAWLYGKGGKNFVDTMLRLGRERDELSVVSDQFGSPTYAKDLAMATKKILTEPLPSGIYHAVNTGMTNWYEFAIKIFQLSKMNVRVFPIGSKDYPVPAKRPKYSVLTDNKGLEMRSWQEALTEYIDS